MQLKVLILNLKRNFVKQHNMIVFDVNALPEGIDLNVWNALRDTGIIFFDSKRGAIPFKLENDLVALVDINTMNEPEIELATSKINEMQKKYDKDAEIATDIAIDNGRKLLEYLRSINDPYKPNI